MAGRFPPKFEDDPEARELVWKTAPRAEDKYGNKLIKIGHYWCSYDFNRLMQIATESKEEFVIIVRVADGRYFGKQRQSFTRGRNDWRRRLSTGWYCYVDPEIQQVY